MNETVKPYRDMPATWNARKKLVLLPPDLTEEFWHGGGHNCSGVEGPSMRKWAIETFKYWF
jgi:hypothetical protein